MIFAEAFGTTWTKQYCTYQKDKKEFTMIPYNQLTGKFVSQRKVNYILICVIISRTVIFGIIFNIFSIEQQGNFYASVLHTTHIRQY